MIKVSSVSRPKKLEGGRGAGGRESDETFVIHTNIKKI
jgi:hypothetical protein